MRTRFTWDPAKARANLWKHGVTFDEAATAFRDPTARILDDPVHSLHEPREILVGHSARERLLLVSFTESDGLIRIISARRATPAERTNHEEGSQG